MTVETGLTKAQVEIRKLGVGASEAYRALMLDPELWAIKTGRLDPDPGNASMRLGNAIEPYIVDEYARAHVNTELESVIAKPDTFRRGHLIAHPDALVVSAQGARLRVVQAKWRGNRDGWGQRGSGDIPDEVTIQTQQEMLLSETRVAHVPVLFMRPPVEVFVVAFDAELAAMIEEGVERFWRYVETDTPPPVDANREEALAAVRMIYRDVTDKRLAASEDLEHWRSVYSECTTLWNRYAATADTAKAHLLLAMQNAGELGFADGTVLRRRLVKVAGYTVEPREHIDARFIKPKG